MGNVVKSKKTIYVFIRCNETFIKRRDNGTVNFDEKFDFIGFIQRQLGNKMVKVEIVDNFKSEEEKQTFLEKVNPKKSLLVGILDGYDTVMSLKASCARLKSINFDKNIERYFGEYNYASSLNKPIFSMEMYENKKFYVINDAQLLLTFISDELNY